MVGEPSCRHSATRETVRINQAYPLASSSLDSATCAALSRIQELPRCAFVDEVFKLPSDERNIDNA